ncbi:FtsX-like permease family protein [Pelomonas sp. APW6]|uniref:FtsX-like permease family protein n=1 Tax=Roseateles subflavus TaxID=3053353 RepID=A0ABT7LES0_9BURK|nr:FtsX-like permease family protein [Pelomonas sp. APW6]MDL5031355.1 FtsX-like permease family protein [Pelomonas sp. APW6]
MALARWQPFEWIVAARFLREGRMQSLFIIVGVSIGVAVIVFMSALLAGLQGNLVRRVLTAQPHIQLLPPKEQVRVLHAEGRERFATTTQAPLQRLKSIDQWQSLLLQLRAMPDIKVVSPTVSGSTLIQRGDTSRSLSLVGVELEHYDRIVSLSDKIVEGRARLGATDILIGIELAHDLGLAVGDKLRVSAASGAANTFEIAGVLDLGNKGANQRTGFVALHSAQSLLGYSGGVTSIDLTVHDVYAAEVVAQRIGAMAPVQADSWIKTNAQFFSAVQSQSTANTAIRFFVGLSVAFGIASVLVVSVVQRSKEIGILRAMGISRGQVMRVFLLQGGLLGLGGALIGCLVGSAALQLWLGYAKTPDGSPMFTITFDPSLYLTALVLATLTGLLAALAPALRAARLDPVVAIRG